MKLEKNSNSMLFSSTEIPDVFFTEYMSQASGDYETREDYLNDLAVRYNVNPIIVSGLAGILGDEEDFDGLVSAIEDMRDMIPAD